MNSNDLIGKCCIVTGGAGVIGETICHYLAQKGLNVAILGRNGEKAKELARRLEEQYAVKSRGYVSDVLNKDILLDNKNSILKDFSSFQYLVNGAGGNSPSATTQIEEISENLEENQFDKTFFGLEQDGFREVFDLNFSGTLLPSKIFGQQLVMQKFGSIVNVSSMNAFTPLTKIPAYSAAKASVNNFTAWLAVHFAKTGVRVNAIAPGFVLTDQNKFLLMDKDEKTFTERGGKIIRNTPMGRFGEPEEMAGTVFFLLSSMSQFITGVTIPIDGGFNAYSGV